MESDATASPPPSPKTGPIDNLPLNSLSEMRTIMRSTIMGIIYDAECRGFRNGFITGVIAGSMITIILSTTVSLKPSLSKIKI